MPEAAHLLRLNSFNQPMVFNDSQSAFVRITYLILLEPGKFQTHPNMGVGLRSLWRHRTGDNVAYELSEEIKRQIRIYLPELTGVNVTVELDNDHTLLITIDTTDGLFAYTYDRTTDKLVTLDQNNVPLASL